MEASVELARALCQEFSNNVSCLRKYNIADSAVSMRWEGELKCTLELEHFTPLLERLVDIGYCCTQVQKDAKRRQCVAWFEPKSSD